MQTKIKAWIDRKLNADSPDNQFATQAEAYDNMASLAWTPPSGLSKFDWFRKRVSTAPHDIIHQGGNVFDTMNPKCEILPRGPDDGDAAEKLERWVEWQFRRANQAGETEPSRETLRHSLLYDRIRAQVEYYDTAEHPFCIKLWHPSVVHYDMGGDGKPTRVAVVNNVTAQSVLEFWESFDADAKIASACSELRSLADADPDARVYYLDFVEKTKDGKKHRIVAFSNAASVTDAPTEWPDKDTTILDQETDGVINWVIVTGSSGSILESLDKSGLWENQNLLDSLADTTVMRRAFAPIYKVVSPTGADAEIDFSAEANGVAKPPPGGDIAPMPIPPLDPGIRELMDRNRAAMGATSGVQNISSIDAVNVQSATLQSVISLRMMELEPYKRNAEKAFAEIMRLMFVLAKLSKQSIPAQRTKDTKYGKKGMPIVYPGPELDMDPQDVIVTCTLLPNTQVDFMQKINAYSLVKRERLPIPDSELVERLDMGDSEVLFKKWQAEQVNATMFQTWQQQKMAEVQLQVQAQQMQMQQQAQQAQQADMQSQQPQGQPGFQNAGGGVPTQGGGPSPYEMNPQMTQTVMQGVNGNA